MNTLKSLLAVAALVALSVDTHAGLLGKRDACGSSKCCDCAPTFQPNCCKPQIVRPCHRNTYNYQRTCAKPFNSCGTCPDNSCCPIGNGCDTGCTTGNGCTTGTCGTNCCPTASGCGASHGLGFCKNILSNLGCNKGCGTDCCDTGCCDTGCGSSHGFSLCKNFLGKLGCKNGCGNDCCDTGCDSVCGSSHGFGFCKNFLGKLGCKNGCGNDCCDTGCGDNCCATTCCPDNACVIAELIYISQTACYARQRRAAIHKLGDKFDCSCNPEIMSAFIYALNDADHRVREKAADEIGDQIRRNHCCCSPCVVAALTNGLADCDRGVRRECEQGLRLCGYKVVDGNCNVCCDTTCCDNGCGNTGCTTGVPVQSVPVNTVPSAPAQDSAPEVTPAPAPAPPAAEERAYYPKRLPEQTARPISARQSLSRLFSFNK